MKNVHKPSTSIKSWSPDDRPMEKMIRLGSGALSNAELLAILIRTGNRNDSALELSKKILTTCGNDLHQLGKATMHELKQTKGIGLTKSMSILAAVELGRRRSIEKPIEKSPIRNSGEVVPYLAAKMKDLKHEVFAVVFLNRANRIIHFEIISQGGIAGTVADPRIILKKAIELSASSMILSHNHPSGNLQPSKADQQITDKISKGAQLMDMKVLDHIIISDEGYLSFVDEGLL